MHYRALTRGQFPARLLDLEHPPELLHLHGRWPVGPAVAVVGTRSASPEALAFTRTLCRELAAEGVVVASGGAEGIDTAAHRGALDAGGHTLVMAPSGFERPFPKSNAELFAEIVARDGGFVSEHPDSTVASRGVFFRRNALLAALAHVVVVVEASFRSGARNTAQCARRLERALFVVPHAPWNRRGCGWVEELRLGARLCLGSQDVFEALEAVRAHAIPEGRSAPRRLELPSAGGDGTLAVELLGALSRGPLHLDDLVERLRRPAAAIQAAVAELCLDGQLRLNAAGLVSKGPAEPR